MLYNILKHLIELGQTTGMAEKLDAFYAVDRITKEQYTELIGMLS